MVTCKSCGAELPPDSQFCPKCGKPSEGEAAQGPQGPQDWRDMRHAYRAARRAERWSPGWGEGWGPAWNEGRVSMWSWAWSPLWAMLSLVFFGLFLVGLGALMFLAAWGGSPLFTWGNIWAYVLILIGLLSFARGVARYLISGHRFWARGITWGIVCVTLGLAWLVAINTGWSPYLWTFIIVAGGLAIVAIGVINYFFGRALPRK